MNFPGRPNFFALNQTHHRADSGRISRWPAQLHAQSGPCARVSIEPGFGAILRHHQIDASVVIEIAKRGAALFAVNENAAFLSGDRLETAAAIAAQPQPASRVAPGSFGLAGEKILAQEQVLMAIAVQIAGTDGEGRGHLRFDGQGARLENTVDSSQFASTGTAAAKRSPRISSTLASP